MLPAPALPGTTAKLPERSAPEHAGVADDPVVVVPGAVVVAVTVFTVVDVCVTVTVVVPPQPAAIAKTANPMSGALMPWASARAARAPRRATTRRPRSRVAPARG